MSEKFSVSGENRGDLRLIAVRGELDLRTCPALKSAIKEALSEGGPAALAVDLSECGFIDSTAISVLLRAREAAQDKDVEFAVIVGTDSQPRHVLKLTRCLPDRLLSFHSRAVAEAALCTRPRRRFAAPAARMVQVLPR